MKKILLTFVLIIVGITVYIHKIRYLEEKSSIGPMPFEFKADTYSATELNAPVLIVGDMMGQRLSQFQELLEKKLSTNYTEGIKVETLATKGESIYRTLHKLKSLKQLPLIILFISNNDTTKEMIFRDSDMSLIKENIKMFRNEYIRTAFMIFPELAKILYSPVKPLYLSKEIKESVPSKSDAVFQSRKLIHYSLYEFALEELITYAKKANSLVINITTPLNLSIAPTKSCDGSISQTSLADYAKAKAAFDKKDYKLTYNLSKELTLLNPSHAESQHLLSQSAYKLQKFNEYQHAGRLAKSYDCQNYDGDPVFNSVMVKLAKQYEVSLLDFDKLITDQSKTNFTFIDEVYPQDLYFEKMINTISSLLKKRLRLAQ